MSTILIDRRTAALLGELAAAPAGDRRRDRAAVDGVSLGVSPSGRASRGAAVATRGSTRRSPQPTRRAAGRAAGNSAAGVAVTLRTPEAGAARLRRRLRCEPVGSRGAAGRGDRGVTPGVRRAAPVRGSLHLTRRGRFVAVLLLLAVLTVAFSFGRVTSTALGTAGGPSAEVVVQSGDTLWSIAERIAPERDPRATAADLMATNGLGSPALEVGQHLRLP